MKKLTEVKFHTVKMKMYTVIPLYRFFFSLNQ